jgi:hypothetical protein
VKIIKTLNQRDNAAKFIYDAAKIILAVTVVGPIAKPAQFNLLLFARGFVVMALLLIFDYMPDSVEIKK